MSGLRRQVNGLSSILTGFRQKTIPAELSWRGLLNSEIEESERRPGGLKGSGPEGTGCPHSMKGVKKHHPAL
jgi:hypothetical protein